MAFQFTKQHRDEYMTAGLTILRGLIPAALLADLRRETDKARVIARSQRGPQTQRLQPVFAYEELNHQPFHDFLELPGLRAAVDGILSPEHRRSAAMGILLEPAEEAWCTAWHRDTHGINQGNVSMEAICNPRIFNQFNAALYDDHSFWSVPGSHNRADTDVERALFPRVPVPAPDLPAHLSSTERELACLEYVRQMPGAVQVVLCAGDVAFYRNTAWHLGNYVPYVKRATLHDGFLCEEDFAVRGVEIRRTEEAVGSGRPSNSSR
jgi:ectoine hydroxylase-related dioxygenase (phytanoyl-CoA dioxygenase family)